MYHFILCGNEMYPFHCPIHCNFILIFQYLLARAASHLEVSRWQCSGNHILKLVSCGVEATVSWGVPWQRGINDEQKSFSRLQLEFTHGHGPGHQGKWHYFNNYKIFSRPGCAKCKELVLTFVTGGCLDCNYLQSMANKGHGNRKTH